MTVPVETPWARLEADAKRERVLAAASELFAADGLDASMPSVAAAAGTGVGSIYRQFADKDDLVAAIVVRRLDEVGALLAAIGAGPDPWADVVRMIRSVIDGHHGCDDVLTEAITTLSGREDVAAARTRIHATIGRMLGRAREQGTLRADADVPDVRLLWAAVRDAERREPGAGERVAMLLLAGLRAR